jgi:hypothetical protein
MAARTVLQPQRLAGQSGQVLVWIPVDAVNGMQVVNSGHSSVLVKSDGTATCTVTFPSHPCSHGRTEVLTGAITAGQFKSWGPFSPPDIWGDGNGSLFLDFSSVLGSVQVAVVEVG